MLSPYLRQLYAISNYELLSSKNHVDQLEIGFLPRLLEITLESLLHVFNFVDVNFTLVVARINPQAITDHCDLTDVVDQMWEL